MTSFNHFNIHPDHVTIRELARWGDDHPDPWVQKLAQLAFYITEVCKDGRDLDVFFEDLDEQIHNLESEVAWAEERAESAEEEAKRLRTERNALRVDLDKNEQEFEIKTLKERIYEHSRTIDELNGKLTVTRSNFDALQKAYKELEEKYNTFIIVAT